MSRTKTPFETHRCDLLPDGFSLRRYEDAGKKYQYPEPGGWVLAFRDYDSEWDCNFLNQATYLKHQHVHFCPWCGENLDAKEGI